LLAPVTSYGTLDVEQNIFCSTVTGSNKTMLAIKDKPVGNLYVQPTVRKLLVSQQ